MLHTVLISIGVNTDRAVQLMRARQYIIRTFPDAQFSPMVTMPAEPVVSVPVNYYSNLLATFTTSLDETSLTILLKDIEQSLGSCSTLRRQGIVMMDIDLLQYDNERRHTSDWQRQYVKKLLRHLFLAFSLLVLSFIPLGRAHAESATTLLSKAIEYYQGRKYHESIIAFEQLQRHYQLNPRFIAYLGFSYYKESMYEEATEYLEKSISQLTAYSPHEQAVYLYACAESHFNLSHYQQALPYYQQALPLTTGLDAADINYHMAFCYYLDETLIPDTLVTDTLTSDTANTNVIINYFLKANRLYKEAATISPLSPLHAARLSQTTKMLRAFMREEEGYSSKSKLGFTPHP